MLHAGSIVDFKIEPTLQQLATINNVFATLIHTNGSLYHVLAQYNSQTNELSPPITPVIATPAPTLISATIDCNEIHQLQYQQQGYLQQRVFRPYIGLRLMRILGNNQRVNYAVTKANPRADNIMVEATVTQVSIDGQLLNYPEEIIRLQKYVRGGLQWEFSDKTSAMPGIADENGNTLCLGTNIGNFNRR